MSVSSLPAFFYCHHNFVLVLVLVGRMSDDGFEDEPLDPRVQEELEKLNTSAEELNNLEMQFIDTRKRLKATVDSATSKLQVQKCT